MLKYWQLYKIEIYKKDGNKIKNIDRNVKKFVQLIEL